MEEGRYSRGYLPHIERTGVPQFVTWRLADALPESAVLEMKAEIALLPEGDRKAEMAQRAEAYCDAGHGACILSDPRVARVCQEAILSNHGHLYRLYSWVVMPNHVHALLSPKPDVSLAQCLHRIKGASSREINRLLAREGRLWQPESFDRWIRGEDHFNAVCRYIEWNPVKAGLCRDSKLYSWSSANEAAQARLESLSQDESCDPHAG